MDGGNESTELTPEEKAVAEGRETPVTPESTPETPPGGAKPAKPADSTVEKPEAPEETELEKVQKGFVKDLKKERTRRQASEAELATALQQNAYLQGQIASGTPKAPEEDPLADVPDDEPLTKAHMKKVIEVEGKKIIAEVGKITQTNTQAQINQRWEATRAKAEGAYTTEKAGEGLDFNSVLARAVEYTSKNKVLQTDVWQSKDPAEALYRLGLTHPDSQAILKTAGARKITDTINAPKPKTTTSKSTPAPARHSDRPLGDLINDPSVTSEQLMKEAEADSKDKTSATK